MCVTDNIIACPPIRVSNWHLPRLPRLWRHQSMVLVGTHHNVTSHVKGTVGEMYVEGPECRHLLPSCGRCFRSWWLERVASVSSNLIGSFTPITWTPSVCTATVSVMPDKHHQSKSVGYTEGASTFRTCRQTRGKRRACCLVEDVPSCAWQPCWLWRHCAYHVLRINVLQCSRDTYRLWQVRRHSIFLYFVLLISHEHYDIQSSDQYMDSHYKYETVERLSYLYIGNHYTGKMTYSYWTGAKKVYCLLKNLFGLTTKKHNKALHRWLLWGESTDVTVGFLSSKARNTENVPMAWRHNMPILFQHCTVENWGLHNRYLIVHPWR